MEDNKKISRRNALKYMGLGILGVAGIYSAIRFTPLNDKIKDAIKKGKIKPVSTRKDRVLGSEVSMLAFGCMRLPMMKTAEGTTVINRDLSAQLIQYAYDNGVNYFDTAYNYLNGESELVVGEILKAFPRESFHLATKMPTWLVTGLDKGKELFQEQLDKCQVEYFDFYLLHALGSIEDYDRAYKNTGVIEYLKEEKAKGRIKRLGFSFHSNAQTMDYLLQQYDWDFVMIQLNYLDWEAQNAKYMYEQLEKHNVQCLVMEPLRGGALATLNPEAVSILKEANPDLTPAGWAFRWAGSLPNVLTILSGMNVMSHVEENINTFRNFKPLTSSEQEAVSKALAAYKKISPVPCTGCAYCMPCNFGVDIPAVFAAYNELIAEGNVPDVKSAWTEESSRKKDIFLARYNQLVSEPAQAHHCTQCGKCKTMCPQEIDIPAELARINEMVQEMSWR